MVNTFRPIRERAELLLVKQALAIKAGCVYALCDSKGYAFYVGKTIRPKRRFAEHVWSLKGGHANVALHKKVTELGDDIRVAILTYGRTSEELNKLERENIARRPWTLNLIGADHWAWSSRHDTKPWMAGTGVRMPSQLLLEGCSKGFRQFVARDLKRMNDVDRCRMEIGIFQKLPFFRQKRAEKWYAIVYWKLLKFVEAAAKAGIGYGPIIVSGN
jgi:hypothetical protein